MRVYNRAQILLVVEYMIGHGGLGSDTTSAASGSGYNTISCSELPKGHSGYGRGVDEFLYNENPLIACSKNELSNAATRNLMKGFDDEYYSRR